MTTMTFQSRPVPRRRVKPKIGRTQVNTIDVIAAFALGFLTVVVSVAIVVAAVSGSRRDTQTPPTMLFLPCQGGRVSNIR